MFLNSASNEFLEPNLELNIGGGEMLDDPATFAPANTNNSTNTNNKNLDQNCFGIIDSAE